MKPEAWVFRGIKHNQNRIAILFREEPRCYRLHVYGPDGPLSGDRYCLLWDLAGELRRNWRYDPSAGETLDAWARTPEWAMGLKRLKFSAIMNATTWQNRCDLSEKLYNTRAGEGGIDAALALIPEIMRELGIDDLWG